MDLNNEQRGFKTRKYKTKQEKKNDYPAEHAASEVPGIQKTRKLIFSFYSVNNTISESIKCTDECGEENQDQTNRIHHGVCFVKMKKTTGTNSADIIRHIVT
jgi:hypothetical protein